MKLQNEDLLFQAFQAECWQQIALGEAEEKAAAQLGFVEGRASQMLQHEKEKAAAEREAHATLMIAMQIEHSGDKRSKAIVQLKLITRRMIMGVVQHWMSNWSEAHQKEKELRAAAYHTLYRMQTEIRTIKVNYISNQTL